MEPGGSSAYETQVQGRVVLGRNKESRRKRLLG